MKYAVDVGSGAIIYIQNFIKTHSAIQKLIGETQKQHGDSIRLYLFLSKYRK